MVQSAVSGSGRRLGGCRGQRKHHFFNDLQAGIADESCYLGGIEPGGVVLDAESVRLAIESHPTDSIYFSRIGQSGTDRFGWRHGIPIDNIHVRHTHRIAVERRGEAVSAVTRARASVVAALHDEDRRAVALIDDCSLIGAGELEMKTQGRVMQGPRRMCAPVADLEVQDLAVEADVEDRFGKTGRGGIGRIQILADVEIEEDCSLKLAALIGNHEIDTGKVVELSTPDAGELGTVLWCGCGDLLRMCALRDKEGQQGKKG